MCHEIRLAGPTGTFGNDVLRTKSRAQRACTQAGHTGSLDPLATGMLPICFGEVTALIHARHVVACSVLVSGTAHISALKNRSYPGVSGLLLEHILWPENMRHPMRMLLL